MTGRRRDVLLLATGAMTGVALALFGLVDAGSSALPEGVVASVNGEPLSRAELDARRGRALQAGARTTPAAVLDAMIEEELLIQHGEALGLVRRDSQVRQALLRAVRTSATAGQRGVEATEAELRALYDEAPELFATPLQLQVEQIWFSRDTPPATVVRAEAALAAGEAFAAVRARFDEGYPRRVPPVPLTLDGLARFFPPPLPARLADLAEGDRTAPLQSSLGTHILRVVARREPERPPFEAVVDQVENELLLRRVGAAYAAYVRTLKDAARVRTALPEAP